mmetsp:Transcript_5879/g.9516  ORF Transcript_5879/g.9516 Transcript_5879/m.9516 type:complete len:81 (-) Transcript_5879:1294-1536(-)
MKETILSESHPYSSHEPTFHNSEMKKQGVRLKQKISESRELFIPMTLKPDDSVDHPLEDTRLPVITKRESYGSYKSMKEN